MKFSASALAVVLLLCIVVYDSAALPRFAARTVAKCQSCHVNPTGGGMRNFYGATAYGRETLPVKSWQEDFALEDFSNQLTEFISYGLDFRFLYFYQKKDNPSTERSSFFPMQMDVYLNMQASKKINVYVNPAFGGGVTTQRWEMFATAQVLPLNGYVKAGRFTPAHGLRLDDHNVYVREKTPFRNNTGQAAGIEAAINPGPLSLTLSAMNAGDDRDDKIPKAVLAKAEARFKIDKLGALLGASTMNRIKSGNDRVNLLSGYGLLSWDENFVLTAAVEYIRGNSSDLATSGERGGGYDGNDVKQVALTVETDYVVVQGVDLKFIYDFFDPNTAFATGAATRYSFGFELFPVSGVELRPLYRWTNDTVLKRKTTDFHLLFHFYL